MGTYRVQVTVGVDVDADSPQRALEEAVNKVRGELGEDPLAPMPKNAWVTGIAQCNLDSSGHSAIPGYMVFETTKTK